MPRRSLIVLLILSGCSVGPNYTRPKLTSPAQYKSPPPDTVTAEIPRAWWKLYNDPILDGLIERANKSNQTLRQAVARVDEARALAKVAAADFYPSIALGPQASIQRLSANRASQLTGTAV